MEERFWSKVIKTDHCWIWNAGVTSAGYGSFYVNGKMCQSHRVIWELVIGPIPEGLFVLHSCDNPPCVRPNHLFLGTQQDNVNDMMRKKRQRTKLTAAEVKEIRQRYPGDGSPQLQLAIEYGVSQRLINQIVNNKIWKEEKLACA